MQTRFWRNYSGAAVDYIEEMGQAINAYEIKYGETRDSRSADAFERTYGTKVEYVNREKYWDFLYEGRKLC